MAIYHFSVKNIARSDGRSSVAAAAYRAGEHLIDHRTGLAHDYTHKRVHHAEMLLPDRAPAWARDRSQLWNAVEVAETRKNSRTSREFEIALPRELTHDQKIALAREFAHLQLVSRGMCADLGFHEFDGKNPHVHILCTTRDINEAGFQGKNRDWNRRELVDTWRVAWANVANSHLSAAGYDARIDHRSLVDQGIDRHAQAKAGPRPDEATRQHNEQCQAVAQAQAALAAEQEQQELAEMVRESVDQNRSHLLMQSARRQVKQAKTQVLSAQDAESKAAALNTEHKRINRERVAEHQRIDAELAASTEPDATAADQQRIAADRNAETQKFKAELRLEKQQFDAVTSADRLLRRARDVLRLARRVPAMLRELQNNMTMEVRNAKGWLQKQLSERNRHFTRQQRNEREPAIRQRETDLWSEQSLEMR